VLSGWIIFAGLTFVNFSVYIMIVMFFEGHAAFNEMDL